jgi:hypothetical protein
MQWHDIEQVMHTLERPTGGFTSAHRGIVTMPDGMKVFVKIGIDEESKHWAQKEIAIYLFLQKHHFPCIPKFLTCNQDRTGFALEALVPENGWDWTETWDTKRLDATLTAMDRLAAIIPSKEEKRLFGPKGIAHDADGWQTLQSSSEKQALLRHKLEESGHYDLASTLDITAIAAKSARYAFHNTVVTHQDVRADNCAWNAEKQRVALIDWNWTQMGDRNIDTNAMLVHVYKSGFTALDIYRDHLDAAALEWLAGFWLNASTNPLRANSSPNQHLREYQLASGVTALDLAAMI